MPLTEPAAVGLHAPRHDLAALELLRLGDVALGVADRLAGDALLAEQLDAARLLGVAVEVLAPGAV